MVDCAREQIVTLPAPVQPDLDTDHVPQTGEPIVGAHRQDQAGRDAAAKVLEARIYGTPLEALCGHVWVPSATRSSCPLCEQCKSIYEMYRAFNDGLNDGPAE